MCTTNAQAKDVNDIIMDEYLGSDGSQMHNLLSSDSVIDAESSGIATKRRLNTIEVSGLPPHRLCVRVGAVIMCI